MKNSLAKKKPKLTKEWHPTKNGKLTPSDVTYGSDRKVWWKCEKGHSWQARIGNRVFLNTGCPYCSNNKVLTGYNDLKTINPKLAKEWHPSKNGNIKPTDVLPHGKYKYWWQCEKGHSYEATLYVRSAGTGCPICANKKILQGYNDLETLKPEFAKEWHSTKNGDLKPTQVSCGSNKKVWWQCEKGHSWQAVIGSRTKKCPICKKEEKKSQLISIAISFPKVLEIWDYERNIGINPDMYEKNSTKKYGGNAKKDIVGKVKLRMFVTI